MTNTNARLLRPGEVAALFRVDVKTASRWAVSGKLPAIKTPGGHWRFPEGPVRAFLAGESTAADGP
ncbi:helix-turn-helix domain-containing protein [Actinoplanes sp. TBRC 11911]|nr:helix-turn-helix domain-containing protein [Actinoplanes sp. TBRC 11911]NMO51986.1 helix-turn-helix domain-containing protein [Actinoplanes sp. TBRC 11911]